MKRPVITGMATPSDRRRILAAGLGAAAGAFGTGVLGQQGGGKEKETPAVEDLMREHGVLRRALLVYSEAAARLGGGKPDSMASALAQTAELFRSFGEDYHERALEEKHVFPAVERSKGAAAGLPAVLKAQHDRGRAITAYILAVTRGGSIASANAAPLAQSLGAFVRMYEHHAAIEDTIVFPAWKDAISQAEYGELTERFEELEHRMFGKDGFEDALQRIARIEQAIGLADLARLTAPLPPKPVS